MKRYDDFVNVHVFVTTLRSNTEPTQLGQIYRELERIIETDITALYSAQGFQYMDFVRPMHTLPQEDSQNSIWHGVGTMAILYHKAYI